MNGRFFIKIIGAVTFLAGIVAVFFYWELGLTLLVSWYFLTGSVLVWLTDDSVPLGTNKRIEQAVKQTIHEGKKRAILFAIVEVAILIVIWTK